jgi:hypothetical protein
VSAEGSDFFLIFSLTSYLQDYIFRTNVANRIGTVDFGGSQPAGASPGVNEEEPVIVSLQPSVILSLSSASIAKIL